MGPRWRSVCVAPAPSEQTLLARAHRWSQGRLHPEVLWDKLPSAALQAWPASPGRPVNLCLIEAKWAMGLADFIMQKNLLELNRCVWESRSGSTGALWTSR